MIVRVLSVRITQDRGAEFHAFIRERGLPRIQAHPGLVSAHVGRRTEGPDEFAIVVTIWRDWHALTEALGPDPSQPYLLTPESGLVETAVTSALGNTVREPVSHVVHREVAVGLEGHVAERSDVGPAALLRAGVAGRTSDIREHLSPAVDRCRR